MQNNHYPPGKPGYGTSHRGGVPPNTIKPNIESLKKILLENNLEEMNRYASELGEIFHKDLDKKNSALSTSQIRTILDELQRMDNDQIQNLNLLRPKLAYAAGRHEGRVKELQQVMEQAIKIVLQGNKSEYMIRFKYFFEAIVAYHRYFGGE